MLKIKVAIHNALFQIGLARYQRRVSVAMVGPPNGPLTKTFVVQDVQTDEERLERLRY